MPGLHQKTFSTIAKRVYSQNERLAEEVFGQAASIVRQEHIRYYHLQADEDAILDISVSFDGSWLTRGHKSLIGIGCVIDVLTGLIIDGHVLSLHCHVCAQMGDWIKRETPHCYEQWKQEHIEKGECTINFEGSSGMMEVRAAEVLWGRFVQRHNLRYTTMVSDGDSKAFNKLLEVQPYGPDVVILKEDCINHVGKRFGTALKNLVANCSKKGITLGGRGHGRLTAETIRKLQIYYTRAIRSGRSAEEMRRGILAGLYHGYSTDEYPQHQFCPPGPDSWCFFKRSIGEHQYPTGHKQRVNTPLDYKLLHQHLEPIYNRLSSVDLLRRCDIKTTQNPNESFHHSVWSRCSKKNFHSLKRVEFALLSAEAEQNSGPTALSTIKTKLGFQEGEHGQRLGQARERKRVYKSSFEQQQKAKTREKKTAAAREKEAEEAQHTRRACFEVGGDQNPFNFPFFFLPNFQS
ncbi:hypothetical protein PoB_003837400 [Plakobranchus ocellatus]|uniref:Mutator-like transposase domain-containing protein n=1 Tax=Plakobranchus ocellatus TaxID=259542 RepID=A0AAV4AVQ5_9GAST|nr:hypothetical protein PoB_003837400 [Plakobranchus ocellatus]